VHEALVANHVPTTNAEITQLPKTTVDAPDVEVG